MRSCGLSRMEGSLHAKQPLFCRIVSVVSPEKDNSTWYKYFASTVILGKYAIFSCDAALEIFPEYSIRQGLAVIKIA